MFDLFGLPAAGGGRVRSTAWSVIVMHAGKVRKSGHVIETVLFYSSICSQLHSKKYTVLVLYHRTYIIIVLSVII